MAIGLLQQIPGVSPTGRYVTIVPLFFILTLIAIKEIIEDLKRHGADHKTNKAKVVVLCGAEWQYKTWKEIRVGDIIRVTNSSFFPSDLGVNGYYKRKLLLDKRYNSVAIVQSELGNCTSCPIRV